MRAEFSSGQSIKKFRWIAVVFCLTLNLPNTHSSVAGCIMLGAPDTLWLVARLQHYAFSGIHLRQRRDFATDFHRPRRCSVFCLLAIGPLGFRPILINLNVVESFIDAPCVSRCSACLLITYPTSLILNKLSWTANFMRVSWSDQVRVGRN